MEAKKMPVAFETCWAESPAHFSQGNKDNLGVGTFPFQSFYSKNEVSTPGPGQMGEKVPFWTPFSAKHTSRKIWVKCRNHSRMSSFSTACRTFSPVNFIPVLGDAAWLRQPSGAKSLLLPALLMVEMQCLNQPHPVRRAKWHLGMSFN